MPFPLPLLVFQSLALRWTMFSGVPLPEELLTFVEHFVVLSRHQVQTEILTFKQKSKQVGFVGVAEFTVVKKNEHLAKSDSSLHGQLQSRIGEFSRMLGMLMAFSFYSGVGIKTTSGMGMVKPC